MYFVISRMIRFIAKIMYFVISKKIRSIEKICLVHGLVSAAIVVGALYRM